MTRLPLLLVSLDVLSLGLAAACGADGASFSSAFVQAGSEPARSDPGREGRGALPTWTVLVYGHGDHELSSSLLDDLGEMAAARIGSEVQVIVVADWNAARVVPGQGSHFPAGAFWYRVPGEGRELERFREEEELDFDDPAVLSDAVERAFSEFPADRYGLVLWDHGGGWSIGFGGDSQDGRRRPSRGLPTEAAAAAIKKGLLSAGLSGKRALDFIAFDACLMAGAETVSAFQDLAQVFIADAELDYGAGWDYQALLTFLSDNRSAPARELARFEVDAWDAHHREAGLSDSLLRSHVAIDTATWARFAADTRTLVEAYRRTLAPAPAALALGRSLPPYNSALASPPGSNLRDLGDILQILAASETGPVLAAARAALASAGEARIAVSSGALREHQLGVHVFGGPPLALPAADLAAYPRLAGAWSAGSGWAELLGQLRAAADADPPAVVAETSPLAGRPRSSATPTVSFEVMSGEQVRLEVTLLRGQPGAGTGVSLGMFAGAFVPPGRYDFVWTGRRWQLAAASGDVVLRVEPWIWRWRDGQLEAPILASRGLLRSSSGEELEGTLLIDAETLQAEAILISEGGRPAIHNLETIEESDPGTAFVPLLESEDLRTGAATVAPATTSVPLPASGKLTLRQVEAEPGPYLVHVRAADVWGNERSTLFPVELAR